MLEKVHTTDVTMGTDYLDLHIELVCCQANGVEPNQRALVSITYIATWSTKIGHSHLEM